MLLRSMDGGDAMRSTTQILAAYKDRVKARFLVAIRRTDLPEGVEIPSDPEEALKLGMKLGMSEGYGEGLVEGTALGMDVGLEAVDEMLSQPVFLVGGGSA